MKKKVKINQISRNRISITIDGQPLPVSVNREFVVKAASLKGLAIADFPARVPFAISDALAGTRLGKFGEEVVVTTRAGGLASVEFTLWDHTASPSTQLERVRDVVISRHAHPLGGVSMHHFDPPSTSLSFGFLVTADHFDEVIIELRNLASAIGMQIP